MEAQGGLMTVFTLWLKLKIPGERNLGVFGLTLCLGGLRAAFFGKSTQQHKSFGFREI